MGEFSLSKSRLVPIAITIYLAIVLVMSYRLKLSLTPDRVILVLLLAGLATGRVRQFLKDWSIFLIVLIAWQVLTGMSHKIGNGFKPHVTEMIAIDRWLFGGNLPTIWLQHRFYTPGRLHWYDIVATLLYTLHFVMPILFAFLLWTKVRPEFVKFMLAFLVMALAGFTTFVFFPAAPPWIAGNWYHVIPHVDKIYRSGIQFFGGQQSLGPIYRWMFQNQNWDYFAAVPSEHAAFPFLAFLFARRVWPRAGWLVLIYCAAVWLSVVYLGEHYVTDVIAGVVYAALAYAAVQVGLAYAERRAAARAAVLPPAGARSASA